MISSKCHYSWDLALDCGVQLHSGDWEIWRQGMAKLGSNRLKRSIRELQFNLQSVEWKVNLTAEIKSYKESVEELRVRETLLFLRTCDNKLFTTLAAWTYVKYMFFYCIAYIHVKAFVKTSRYQTSAFEKLTSARACWQLSAWTRVCQTARHTLWVSPLMEMRLRIQDLSKNLVSFVPFIWKF